METMKTSAEWASHFGENLKIARVDWDTKTLLTTAKRKIILKSLQAWQLDETSDGAHLLKAARRYADKTNDMMYPLAVELFIKEEQKHGNNLGIYLDRIGEKRIKKDWGDSMFRKIRYHNNSMELWTLAVITVESTAQIFYQSLKDATGCPLLKQICTDILIDEAAHIEFQQQRMQTIYGTKNPLTRLVRYWLYKCFYYATISVVFFAHRKVFEAGGNGFFRYFRKMRFKFRKTFGKLRSAEARAFYRHEFLHQYYSH
jgi:hypothetical protein